MFFRDQLADCYAICIKKPGYCCTLLFDARLKGQFLMLFIDRVWYKPMAFRNITPTFIIPKTQRNHLSIV